MRNLFEETVVSLFGGSYFHCSHHFTGGHDNAVETSG